MFNRVDHVETQTLRRNIGYYTTIVVWLQVYVGQPSDWSSGVFPPLCVIHKNRLTRSLVTKHGARVYSSSWMRFRFFRKPHGS